ncbi:aminotransferase class V-fold PLP-dependent enzyme [Catalinimonas niigatensis]|uniref:aminotransferase class V-fold PLP-dependent enzyme n=1 Tax=Catalinimonas niigatensis TaxID=1397264 RepID=UPI002666D8CF|nr:aminotransferase class V-fold PLP-dependent enzyme [Catalinimonas niigatensis]WPP49364.1 aminotransferase class V-fold PLP-dependent enzyme [Catalinimonas niigatensis]
MNKTINNSDSFSKRKFLKQIFTGSVASLSIPAWADAYSSSIKEDFYSLSTHNNAADERYWEMVKKQFTISDKLLMVNAANLCPSPYFVTEQAMDAHEKLEKDVSFQYRSVFASEREQALKLLAEFVGVNTEEIGITRNTTESNNIIVHGLDLKKGDEVLLWDQNHPTNGIAWEQQAKRYGFSVKTISLPLSPTSTDQLIGPFTEAITSKTRLISFSHISNSSGIALPAKEICALAKAKNILSMVDGAQSLGMMNLDLKDMGCDFYTSSTHKWLMGPLENGILYVKKEQLDRVWPAIIGAGWNSESNTVDEKLCMLGQRNEPSASALAAIVNFHHTIGKQQIEERVKALNTYLKQEIKKKIPTATFVTPLAPALSGGVTIMNLPAREPRAVFQTLYEAHGIACAPTGGLRFSPHIYNTLADIDRIVEALTTIV